MSEQKLEVATVAGGCFWCLEAVFRMVDGVVKVESGYTGGMVANPTYEQVSTGRTGHAESVRITFDADRLTYKQLLQMFFSAHDPTTLNRQGADIGTQYRSAIFYHDENQKATAEAVIRELTEAHKWKDPIVTQVVPAGPFYPAEEYHERYYERNPNVPYSRAVIAPKVAKFKKEHPARLKRS